MNITIVTTADSNDSGLALLKAFGLPFQKDQAA
jgi:ribosomal protein L5